MHPAQSQAFNLTPDACRPAHRTPLTEHSSVLHSAGKSTVPVLLVTAMLWRCQEERERG
jgi:hypothetical protein